MLGSARLITSFSKGAVVIFKNLSLLGEEAGVSMA
jgi:hypothetical protein